MLWLPVWLDPRSQSMRGVRMIVAAMNVMGGAHASFGPHSFLFAFGNGVGSDGKSWDGDPPHMTSHLVLCSTLPCSSNTKTQ